MPSPTRKTLAVALAILAVSAVGCAPGDPDVDSLAATQGLPNLLINLSADDWLLDPGGTTVALGDEPISLDFHADRTASGVAPCNTYRAVVELGNGTVRFTDVTTSLRACEPQIMDDETAFFAALEAVRDVDLSDRDRLVLTAPGGETLAFESFNAYEAIATTWTVLNVASDDALVSTPSDADARITFDEHRTLTVDAGCGERTGEWSLDDDKLTVSELSPSETCDDADAAEIEAAVIAALDDARSVQLNPPTMTLLGPGDTILLIASAER